MLQDEMIQTKLCCSGAYAQRITVQKIESTVTHLRFRACYSGLMGMSELRQTCE